MPESSSSPQRRRGRRGFLFFVLLVVVAAGVWWWSGQQGADDTDAPGGFAGGMRGGFGGPVPVRAGTADLRQMDHTLQAIGTVTALNTVTVNSRVEGELDEILFNEGGYVEKNDVIARIDPRTYQVGLEQAQGQLAQTRARLTNAKQDLQRYEQLFGQQSIARQQLDSQQALVNELEATQQANQAAVEDAQLQLSFTDIVAPVSGRVGLRQVDVGNLIRAGSTDGLVVITQTQPISVRFSLPQADLPDVQAAMQDHDLKVDVYGSDGGTILDSGTLQAVDNQIDTATGTVSLKARLPNQDEALFPNQFVNVRLHVESGERLAIPSAALQYGSIGAFVYVIDEDDSVRVQEVAAGQADGRYVMISAGLEAGDRVVLEGVDRLREGSEVEVIEDETGDGNES